MKASEVIKKLQSDIDLVGDTDVGVIIYLGQDSEGVSRCQYSEDIRIAIGYQNTEDRKLKPKIDIHVDTTKRNTKQVQLKS